MIGDLVVAIVVYLACQVHNRLYFWGRFETPMGTVIRMQALIMQEPMGVLSKWGLLFIFEYIAPLGTIYLFLVTLLDAVAISMVRAPAEHITILVRGWVNYQSYRLEYAEYRRKKRAAVQREEE